MQLKLYATNLLLVLMISLLDAKDFGQRGHLFPIEEDNLLKVIMERLDKAKQDGLIGQHQKALLERTEENLFLMPKDFVALKSNSSSVRYYDPSITLSNDLKTANGTILAKKGDVFNPLKKVEFGDPMIFIDGEDAEQCLWSLKQNGQIIFVRGNSIRFEEQHQRPIFYDQHHKLIEKFKLQRFPSVISQEGEKLKIEEVGDFK
jgi:conjugal transfer pilus assembly protein TraW